MRVAIGKQVINGIVIAVLIVLAIAALSIWQYRRIQDTGALVRRTNQVLYQIEMVSATEMQYELNLKNFQLTGDSSFLVVADDSARRLPASRRVMRACRLARAPVSRLPLLVSWPPSPPVVALRPRGRVIFRR